MIRALLIAGGASAFQQATNGISKVSTALHARAQPVRRSGRSRNDSDRARPRRRRRARPRRLDRQLRKAGAAESPRRGSGAPGRTDCGEVAAPPRRCRGVRTGDATPPRTDRSDAAADRPEQSTSTTTHRPADHGRQLETEPVERAGGGRPRQGHGRAPRQLDVRGERRPDARRPGGLVAGGSRRRRGCHVDSPTGASGAYPSVPPFERTTPRRAPDAAPPAVGRSAMLRGRR